MEVNKNKEKTINRLDSVIDSLNSMALEAGEMPVMRLQRTHCRQMKTRQFEFECPHCHKAWSEIIIPPTQRKRYCSDACRKKERVKRYQESKAAKLSIEKLD